MERAQRRNADLVSKNSSLSAELKNFQIYMRETSKPSVHRAPGIRVAVAENGMPFPEKV